MSVGRHWLHVVTERWVRLSLNQKRVAAKRGSWEMSEPFQVVAVEPSVLEVQFPTWRESKKRFNRGDQLNIRVIG